MKHTFNIFLLLSVVAPQAFCAETKRGGGTRRKGLAVLTEQPPLSSSPQQAIFHDAQDGNGDGIEEQEQHVINQEPHAQAERFFATGEAAHRKESVTFSAGALPSSNGQTAQFQFWASSKADDETIMYPGQPTNLSSTSASLAASTNTSGARRAALPVAHVSKPTSITSSSSGKTIAFKPASSWGPVAAHTASLRSAKKLTDSITTYVEEYPTYRQQMEEKQQLPLNERYADSIAFKNPESKEEAAEVVYTTIQVAEDHAHRYAPVHQQIRTLPYVYGEAQKIAHSRSEESYPKPAVFSKGNYVATQEGSCKVARNHQREITLENTNNIHVGLLHEVIKRAGRETFSLAKPDGAESQYVNYGAQLVEIATSGDSPELKKAQFRAKPLNDRRTEISQQVTATLQTCRDILAVINPNVVFPELPTLTDSWTSGEYSAQIQAIQEALSTIRGKISDPHLDNLLNICAGQIGELKMIQQERDAQLKFAPNESVLLRLVSNKGCSPEDFVAAYFDPKIQTAQNVLNAIAALQTQTFPKARIITECGTTRIERLGTLPKMPLTSSDRGSVNTTDQLVKVYTARLAAETKKRDDALALIAQNTK